MVGVAAGLQETSGAARCPAVLGGFGRSSPGSCGKSAAGVGCPTPAPGAVRLRAPPAPRGEAAEANAGPAQPARGCSPGGRSASAWSSRSHPSPPPASPSPIPRRTPETCSLSSSSSLLLDQLVCWEWSAAAPGRRLESHLSGPRRTHPTARWTVPLGLPCTHLRLADPCPHYCPCRPWSQRSCLHPGPPSNPSSSRCYSQPPATHVWPCLSRLEAGSPAWDLKPSVFMDTLVCHF